MITGKEFIKVAGLSISIILAVALFIFLLPLLLAVFIFMLLFGKSIPIRSVENIRVRGRRRNVPPEQSAPAAPEVPASADTIDVAAVEVDEENS